jgi:hypothetical protein
MKEQVHQKCLEEELTSTFHVIGNLERHQFPISIHLLIGVRISDKKNLRKTKQMAISDGIPAVPRNRKLSEFCSKSFRGRENSSEFCSVDTKIEASSHNSVGTLLQKRKQLGISFLGTKIEAYSWNFIPNHSAEENTTRNSFPWNKIRKKLSECHSERGSQKL